MRDAALHGEPLVGDATGGLEIVVVLPAAAVLNDFGSVFQRADLAHAEHGLAIHVQHMNLKGLVRVVAFRGEAGGHGDIPLVLIRDLLDLDYDEFGGLEEGESHLDDYDAQVAIGGGGGR